jgi:hypothetical protein
MAFKHLEGRLSKVSLIDKKNPSIGIIIKIAKEEKIKIKNYFDSSVYLKLKEAENIGNISIVLQRYFNGSEDINPEYKITSLMVYREGGEIIDNYFHSESDKKADIIQNYKNK